MELYQVINALIEYYHVLLIIAAISLALQFIRKKNLPPGPWGLPIVGYFPFLKQPRHIGITELGKKYGSVMSLYLGSVLVIVLNDYKTIKEAFVKQGNLFSGKPISNSFRVNTKDKGFALTEGEEASQHRRFVFSTFKDFGVGKLRLEQHLMVEIHSFLDEIRKLNGQPTNIKMLVNLSISNVIATLEFGKRFEYADPQFCQLKQLMESRGKFVSAVVLHTFFPWIEYIPFTDKYTRFHELRNGSKSIKAFFREKVKENEENYIEGSRSHYLDGYLTERNCIIKKTGTDGYFTEEHLIGNLQALLTAGTNTTTNVLLWSILYLLKYPNAMEKVLKEISEVIGENRDPTSADKYNMPYSDAFLLEVHRHCSHVPLTLAHSNIEETTISGFTIPKRSYVIGNLWAVHHDENLWKNPNEFNPQRFINEQGKVEKPEYLIPFSIGKRNCIGEQLASMEIFLYFTTLLQNFEIKLPIGEVVSMESEFGIGLYPKPFKICAIAKT